MAEKYWERKEREWAERCRSTEQPEKPPMTMEKKAELLGDLARLFGTIAMLALSLWLIIRLG